MQIARIIGKVTLSRAHPSFQRETLRLAIKVAPDDLARQPGAEDELIVTCDELGAGDNSLIALSEGPEAAQPFYPEIKPVDAYNAAILDCIDVGTPIQL